MKTKKRSKRIKIEAKPLNEEQIKVFVAHYKKNGSFPGSKIPCTVTGKLTTCLGPWMKKKIKEFGGVEELLRNYKCRGVLKTERQIIKPIVNKKRRKITKELKDENKEWSIPKINFTPPRPLTGTEIAETTQAQCLRPDIYLTNGRHCDGCEWYEVCQNPIKSMPNYTGEIKVKKTRGPKIKRK